MGSSPRLATGPPTAGASTAGGERHADIRVNLSASSNTKTVHLIRHAEGHHNVWKNGEDYPHKDPHLTDAGYAQVERLRAHIAACPHIRPEVVVVSPLARALQTACGAFGAEPAGDSGPEGSTNMLMIPQSEVPGIRTGHAAVWMVDGGPPLVAEESCREHLGVAPCDRRHPTAVHMSDFPGVSFDRVTSAEDVLWTADRRETEMEMAARGLGFLEWLCQRPEKEVAVVSHSSILHWMLFNFVNSDVDCSSLSRKFRNCELRTFTMSWSGQGSRDPTWFHPDNLHLLQPTDPPTRLAFIAEVDRAIGSDGIH